MLLWIIICVVVCVIALILSSKVGVRVLAGEDLRIWVKVGFWMKQIYPAPPGKEKKDTKKKESEAKKKRKITWEAVQQLLRDIYPPLLCAMGRFRRGVRVRRLEGRIVVGDPDPAAAAKRYGTLNAVLWPALALVENIVTVERRSVQIDLDFAAGRTRASGEVFLTIRIFHLLAISLGCGLKLMGPVSRFLKVTKAVEVQTVDSNKNETKNAAA